MDDATIAQIRTVMYDLAARQMVLDAALQTVVRLGDETFRANFARLLTQQVQELTHELADQLTPQMDSTMTVTLATLLEASGHSPSVG